MTTKAAGGKITGLLALTMEANEGIPRGNFVHIVGDYEVAPADGTRPVLGHVSVSNLRGRVSDQYSTSVANPVTPGEVTVEARGFYVKMMPSAGVIEAGTEVGIGPAAAGAVVNSEAAVASGANVATIGIALTGASAAGQAIDVLVR